MTVLLVEGSCLRRGRCWFLERARLIPRIIVFEVSGGAGRRG